MSVYKIFILLVSITECMERSVMTSFRILSSFECFLRYFQTEWSVFFTLQYELFTSCKVFNNASFVSTRTGVGGWSTKCGQAWIGEGEGGGKSSQISADILYEWPLTCLICGIRKYLQVKIWSADQINKVFNLQIKWVPGDRTFFQVVT